MPVTLILFCILPNMI
ncbi:unnamed protein product [Nezara viridula]|uniref:Uncharacterized protein n=1 Tax=Nezara viridula TaxID=85310 RepID=A0A9P0MW82_NEZVI|nr:unnamed protein product [Nezara viridula]